MIYIDGDALKTLRPNEQYVWMGHGYSGLTWLESSTPPTEDEINTEAESEVTGFNNKIFELESLIKSETEKVTPLREKNIENLSKIQRLNLELQNLDEENNRIQNEFCLLYTSPSPRDVEESRMPSSA